MFHILAFFCFVVAFILILSGAAVFIEPLGWIAAGLALQAAPGGHAYVNQHRGRNN